MHTALRLGVEVAARARAVNPGAHLCFFGLYATLNADYLFAHGADSVIGGEAETPLLALVDALERGDAGPLPAVARPGQPAAPASHAPRLPGAEPRGPALASRRYAHVERDGRMVLVGYVGGEPRLPAPLPALPDPAGLRRALLRGAARDRAGRHPPAGRGGRAPHHLRRSRTSSTGPRHALAVARELHAEWPDVTFDFTAKIEHLLRHRAHLPALAAARLPLHRLRRRVAERHRARASRQGPHARRHPDRARGHARGRHRAAAHVGGLHAVDHARRLPRLARLPRRRRT